MGAHRKAQENILPLVQGDDRMNYTLRCTTEAYGRFWDALHLFERESAAFKGEPLVLHRDDGRGFIMVNHRLPGALHILKCIAMAAGVYLEPGFRHNDPRM